MSRGVRRWSALLFLGALCATGGSLLATESESGRETRDAAFEFFRRNPEVKRYYDSLYALPESALPDLPAYPRARLREHVRRMLFAPESLHAGPDAAHASDTVMTTRFRNQRADFERLLRMFQADSTLERISDLEYRIPNSPRPSPERQSEYDSLFARLGVRSIQRGENLILLRVSTVWTFDRKGYAWSPGELTPLTTMETTQTGEFRVYKRVAPGWYIYFQPSS